MLAATTSLPEESLRAMRLVNPAPFGEWKELEKWSVKGNRYLSGHNSKEVLELRVQAYVETALRHLEKQHQEMRTAQQKATGEEVTFGSMENVMSRALNGISFNAPRVESAEERLRMAQWQILIYFLPCVVEPDCALRVARCVQVLDVNALVGVDELEALWLQVRKEVFWNTDQALNRDAYLKELLEFRRAEGEECLNFLIRLDALLLKGVQRFSIHQNDEVRTRTNGAPEVSFALLYAWPCVVASERKVMASNEVYTLEGAITVARTEVSGVTQGKYSSSQRIYGDQYAPGKDTGFSGAGSGFAPTERGGGGPTSRTSYAPASGLYLPAADRRTFVAQGDGVMRYSGGVRDGVVSSFKYRDEKDARADKSKVFSSGKPTVTFGGSSSSGGGGDTRAGGADVTCPHCGNAHTADNCWKQFPGKAPCGLRACVGKPSHSKNDCTVTPWKRPDKPVTRSMGGGSPTKSAGSYSTTGGGGGNYATLGGLAPEDFGSDCDEKPEELGEQEKTSKEGKFIQVKGQAKGKSSALSFGVYGDGDKYLFAKVKVLMEDLSLEPERTTDPKRMFVEERYRLEAVAALDTCSGPSLISFELAVRCGAPMVGSMILGTLNGETPPTPVVLAWVLGPTGRPVRMQFGIAAKSALPAFRAGKGRAQMLIGMQDIVALGVDLNELVYGGGLSLSREIPKISAVIKETPPKQPLESVVDLEEAKVCSTATREVSLSGLCAQELGVDLCLPSALAESEFGIIPDWQCELPEDLSKALREQSGAVLGTWDDGSLDVVPAWSAKSARAAVFINQISESVDHPSGKVSSCYATSVVSTSCSVEQDEGVEVEVGDGGSDDEGAHVSEEEEHEVWVREDEVNPALRNFFLMVGLNTPTNETDLLSKMGLLRYVRSGVPPAVWSSTTRVIQDLAGCTQSERQSAFDELLTEIHMLRLPAVVHVDGEADLPDLLPESDDEEDGASVGDVGRVALELAAPQMCFVSTGKSVVKLEASEKSVAGTSDMSEMKLELDTETELEVEELRETLYQELGYYPTSDFATAASWEDPKIYFQGNSSGEVADTVEVARSRMQPFCGGTDGTEEELANNWLSLNLKLGLRAGSEVLRDTEPVRESALLARYGPDTDASCSTYTVPGPGSLGWCYALAVVPTQHENLVAAFSTDELVDAQSATPELSCTLRADGRVDVTGCLPEVENCYLGESKVRVLLERRIKHLKEYGNPAKLPTFDRIMKGVAKERIRSLLGKSEGAKVLSQIDAMVRLFVSEQFFSDQPGLATHVPLVSIKLKAGAESGLRSHKCPVFGPATAKVLRDYVNACLAAGTHKLVPPSQAAYAWRPVISCKDMNSDCPKLRVCNDVTSVNQWEEGGQTPVPFPSWIRVLSAGHVFICTMDISAGFNNLGYDDETSALYGLWTPLGVLVPLRMIFGGTTNSARFQEAMEKALATVPELGTSLFVYIDDVIVFSKTIQEHIDLVTRVVVALGSVGFKLAPDKFHFGCAEATVLGFLVGENGVSPAPHNLSKMVGLTTPNSEADMLSKMGLLQYYKSSVDSTLWLSTTRVVRNLAKPQCERQLAFDKLLEAIHSAPPLAAFDPKAQLVLDCDASNLGAGGCLSLCSWKNETASGPEAVEVSSGFNSVVVASHFDEEGRLKPDKEQPLEWYAKPWTEAQSRWPIYVREAFALIYCLEQAALFTESSVSPVVVRTDHRPLMWLRHATSPMVVRWVAQFLQNLSFRLEYRPGSRHCNADFASRDLVLLESSAPGQPTRSGRLCALEALVDHRCCPTLSVSQRFLLCMDGVESEASAFLRERGKSFSTPLVASPTAKTLAAGWEFGIFTPPAERSVLWAAILFAQGNSFALLLPSDLVHLIPLADQVSVSRFRDCVRIAFLDSNVVWLVVGLESKLANQVLWTEEAWVMDMSEALSFAELLPQDGGPLSSEPVLGERRKSRRVYSGFLHETEEEMRDALGNGVFLVASHGRKSRLNFVREDVAAWYRGVTEDTPLPMTEEKHLNREWVKGVHDWMHVVNILKDADPSVGDAGTVRDRVASVGLERGSSPDDDGMLVVEDADGVLVTKKGVVFLPPPFHKSALTWCHRWSNHGGVRNALLLLHTRFVWPSSRADVEKFVRDCVFCALANAQHTQAQVYRSLVPQRPCQIIGVDWFGPFTPDNAGNKYVFSQVDLFSDFTTYSADSVATAQRGVYHLAEHTLYPRGVPEAVLSDNHSVFRAQMVAGVCQEVGIRQLFTAPYSQFQNGKVERRMAFLSKFLQSLDSADLRNWGTLMAVLSCMINAIPNAVTGLSPAQLERPWTLSGNQITSDHALLAQRLEEEVSDDERAEHVGEYLRQMTRVSELFHRLVREEKQVESERVLQRTNDKNRKGAVQFKARDRVAIARPVRKANMSQKLLLQWKASFEVVAEVANNKFLLRHEDDGSEVYASPRNMVSFTPSLRDTLLFYEARSERDILAVAEDMSLEDFQFGEQLLPGSIVAMGDPTDGDANVYWLGRVLDLDLAEGELTVQYYVTLTERPPVFILAWVDQADGAIVQRVKAPSNKVAEPWLGVASLASVFAIKLSLDATTNKLTPESALALKHCRPAVMKVKRG